MDASKVKILIVDDDASMRLLLSQMLVLPEYEVTTIDNGEDGLATIQQGGFDLILLDVMLPKIDGIGILTELANHTPKVKNGKIILFTSLHDDPAVKEGLSKGADGFIVKSDFPPDVLLAKVKNLL
jgi:DNA-binding response OmpR family regulator